MTVWHGLLVNLAILAIFVSIWAQLNDSLERLPPWQRNALTALLLAAGTLALMLLPFELRPGVFVDLRATLIVLAGFFGGPIVGIAAAVAAAVYRLWLGGEGAMAGVYSIGIACAVGICGERLLGHRLPRATEVLMLAASVTVSIAAAMFMHRRGFDPEVARQVWFPIETLTFVATAIAGLALAREKRRAALTRQNELYAAVIDALPDPLNAKDLEGRFIVANPATAKLMRANSAGDLLGRTDADFYAPAVAARFAEDEKIILEGGSGYAKRQHVVFDDGSETWLASTKAPFHDSRGRLVGVITHSRDISARKRLEEEHEQVQRRYSEAVANMSDGLVVFDENGKIAYCNPQYTALFPKTAELRTPGHALVDIVRAGIRCGEEIVPSGMDEATWVESARTSLRTPGSRLLHMADGRWLQVRIRPGKDGGALALVSDISAMKNAEDKLIQMNARLEALASTDSLTGLQNRRSFDDALAREFTRNARSDTPLSVLIVDVDRFKAYNDAYGHPQGDECLKEVAAVLTMAVHRPADIVARYGGEEFVVLLPETNDEGAWSRAEKIRNAVRDLNIAHRGSDKGRVTVTIGIAVRAGGDVSPSDLIRRADAALYAGKTSGRDQTRGPHGGEDPRRRLAG